MMNHCFEICHYQQNVPQHYYLLDTLVLNPVYVAACSLRSLRSKYFDVNQAWRQNIGLQFVFRD